MFTAELKINGAMVATLYGHNTSTVDKDGRGVYTYSYWEPKHALTINGTIAHAYADGLDALVAKILIEVNDERMASKS